MATTLKDFEAAMRLAQTRVANATDAEATMIDTLFKNPVQFDGRGRAVNAVAAFERRVQRIHVRATGRKTTWVPIGVIVAFIVLHWSEIMAALKVIVFLFRLRRK